MTIVFFFSNPLKKNCIDICHACRFQEQKKIKHSWNFSERVRALWKVTKTELRWFPLQLSKYETHSGCWILEIFETEILPPFRDVGLYLAVRDYLDHFHSHDISNKSERSRKNRKTRKIRARALVQLNEETINGVLLKLYYRWSLMFYLHEWIWWLKPFR